MTGQPIHLDRPSPAVSEGTAVVVMAYGSPSQLEDVPAYYADIRGGRPVPSQAVERLRERYRQVGGSPLNEITERQRAALERELGMPVYVGMKHWQPRISDAVEAALAAGARRFVGLVLAPHYSRISIGGYRNRLEAALQGRAELVFIPSWHVHPGFLDLLADRLRGTSGHVVFTAHSLPARILDEGDPYVDQLSETATLVAARAGIERFSVAFQSASETGEPWLTPTLLELLERLRAEGVDDVLVAPAGFVADHLEILWDVDVEACERAQELGLRLERIASPNDDPRFIRALSQIVRGAIEEG